VQIEWLVILSEVVEGGGLGRALEVELEGRKILSSMRH
jgi:hypothetical protein